LTIDVKNHAREGRRTAVSYYTDPWRDAFDDATAPFLVPNVQVLDIGAGREPTIRTDDRPAGCRYVGLDISETELRFASDDAYDEIVVGDVARRNSSLSERFDLAVSWDVLEHVKPLDFAVANVHSYLRPGGVFVAQFAGKFSVFALLNQLVPRRVGLRLLHQLLGRDEVPFPAYYHSCYASALERMLINWSDFRIIPRFRGADYFAFSRRAQHLYVRYEDWALRSGRANLATHYLLTAQK
jgi:SAM-dependent methyltransferase